jgi:hypothetical protein
VFAKTGNYRKQLPTRGWDCALFSQCAGRATYSLLSHSNNCLGWSRDRLLLHTLEHGKNARKHHLARPKHSTAFGQLEHTHTSNGVTQSSQACMHQTHDTSVQMNSRVGNQPKPSPTTPATQLPCAPSGAQSQLSKGPHSICTRKNERTSLRGCTWVEALPLCTQPPHTPSLCPEVSPLRTTLPIASQPRQHSAYLLKPWQDLPHNSSMYGEV